MRRSDCTDAQADLRLYCSRMAKTGFLMTWLINGVCIAYRRIRATYITMWLKQCIVWMDDLQKKQ